MSATPGGTRWMGPQLGEHNHAILQSLGYSDAEIQALREQGVTG